MIGYRYQSVTKEYVGTTIVMEDPLESARLGKSVLSFPPRCTLLAPPEVNANEVAVFNEQSNSWEVKSDFRGLVAYDKKGNANRVETIGDLPTGYSLEKPMTLEDLKAKATVETSELYNSLLSKELTVGQVKTKVLNRPFIVSLIKSFGDYASTPYENIDGTTVIITKEEAEEAEKYLYLYQMLLAKEKNKLIRSISACSSKKAVSELEIRISIDYELKSLMKLSTEEINEYFTTGE